MQQLIERRYSSMGIGLQIEIPRVPFARPPPPPPPSLASSPFRPKKSVPCSRGNRFAASQKNGRNCILFLFGRAAYPRQILVRLRFVDAEINFNFFEPVDT